MNISCSSFTVGANDLTKRIFTCDFPACGLSFLYKSEMTKHMQTHSSLKTLKCPHPDCWKYFKRTDTLENHIRLHTGEKPFVCHEHNCNQKFANKAGLRYHLLKHKNEKKHICKIDQCGKSFLTLAQLKQHEQSGTHNEKALLITRTKKSSTDFSKPSDSTEMESMSGEETGHTATFQDDTYDEVLKKVKLESNDYIHPVKKESILLDKSINLNFDETFWKLPEWANMEQYFKDF